VVEVFQQLPAFLPEDAEAVAVYNQSGLKPDLSGLIGKPLDWDLTLQEPTVLIIHTHATESYTKHGENYTESSDFRTLDEHYNMISIGDRVAEILSSHGISVLHDRDLHDYPSYNGSYASSREAIAEYLQRYPDIQLVLDLHRDASGDLNNQFRPVVQVDGQATAQMMLVMGTDASGQSHPNWQKNLSLGLKLHVTLEQQAPGIMRPLCLRSQRFNQDMTAGSLLIEMGAAGNSHPEALRAAEQLAYAIVTLAQGSQ
jgi:stage II sporulation protein P